jgi:hypothetical protein
MSDHPRLPSLRSLDIYRLVAARGIKQATVAQWFGVTPARISQIASRVRQWVNHSIGDWLFPGRDDLRFYVALECERIRVEESHDEPENVVLTGPGWTYTRRITPAQHGGDGTGTLPPSANQRGEHPPIASNGKAGAPAITPSNTAPHISAEPLNSPERSAWAPPDATAAPTTDFIPPHIDDMAYRVAQLLMLWKKTRKVSSAIKSPSRSSYG